MRLAVRGGRGWGAGGTADSVLVKLVPEPRRAGEPRGQAASSGQVLVEPRLCPPEHTAGLAFPSTPSSRRCRAGSFWPGDLP